MNIRRPLLAVVFLTIVTAIVFVARYGSQDGGRLRRVDEWLHLGNSKGKEAQPTPCTEHLGWLAHYHFTPSIQYVSRDIIAVPSEHGDRPSLTVVDKPLFDDFTTIDLAHSRVIQIARCHPPLKLEVPRLKSEPADASNIIFGLQTTKDRLKETVKHLARWLPHTKARLYAIVIETEDLPVDDNDIASLEKDFHSQGMDVTIIHPVKETDTFAQRYFSLVNVTYEARDENTKWVSLIDDDTFFPSMHDLLAMLAKHDHSKPQYIGSLSEDWWAVNNYGLMGFGGAGIMLSAPMAQIIHEHSQDCADHLRTTAGDISVMDCIYQYSDTKLTHIPSLHQVDMHGDLTGFYESGREMLSLHHWKEGSAAGYKLEMEKMHLVADICDSCFLQRWQFSKDLVLSNGFSIAHYPQGHLSGEAAGVLGTVGVGKKVEKISLLKMEETWQDAINVKHSLEPKRPKMSEENKIGYKLLDSFVTDGDAAEGGKGDVVRQVYLKEGGEGEKDTVMVLNWRAAATVYESSTAETTNIAEPPSS